MSVATTQTISRGSATINDPDAAPPDPTIDHTWTSTELDHWNTSTRRPAVDGVVEASRIADESAPDGGYGWYIVGACSLLTFWFVGTTYSWGVIQGALGDAKLAKPSTLAFLGSLDVACLAAFALVNGRLIRAIGARKVAILGVMMMGVGQIWSGWATKSVVGLFFTEGLIMGYGVRYVGSI